MTTKTYIGGGRNIPSVASSWSPSGAPKSGDTLLMSSGVMNVSGSGLAGDTVTLQQTPAGKSDIFNLFNHAVLATTTAANAKTNATVNVDGRATASLAQGAASTADYTVNLHAGATLVGRYDMSAKGTLNVEGQTGAKFENDANSRNDGTTAVINADVVGTGSFTVGPASSRPGFLEFGKGVAKTETVNLQGDPTRGKASLVIDRPADFHAAVNMSWGTIDLKNLGGGSYSYHNDILSLFQNNKVVETLSIRNMPAGNAEGAVVPLNVERHGADILISSGPKVYATDPTLFNRG